MLKEFNIFIWGRNLEYRPFVEALRSLGVPIKSFSEISKKEGEKEKIHHVLLRAEEGIVKDALDILSQDPHWHEFLENSTRPILNKRIS